jgi:hypothetical protein
MKLTQSQVKSDATEIVFSNNTDPSQTNDKTIDQTIHTTYDSNDADNKA